MYRIRLSTVEPPQLYDNTTSIRSCPQANSLAGRAGWVQIPSSSIDQTVSEHGYVPDRSLAGVPPYSAGMVSSPHTQARCSRAPHGPTAHRAFMPISAPCIVHATRAALSQFYVTIALSVIFARPSIGLVNV